MEVIFSPLLNTFKDMFLKTKVKADNIKNLTDARYFAAAGVEWLGFSVTDAMPVEDVQSIMDWVDGVKVVLEIDGDLSATSFQLIETLTPDFIQVGLRCNLDDLHEGIPVIRVVNSELIQEGDVLDLMEEHIDLAEGFIIDLSAYSWDEVKSGIPTDFAILKTIIEGYSCLLKLKFSSQDILTAIETLQPDGICLEGGDEEKVGYKNFESLDDLLEVLTLD